MPLLPMPSPVSQPQPPHPDAPMTSSTKARARPQGTCKLCLNVRELQQSHFIPAALYPKNQILFGTTPTAALISPDEVADYLLCSECEQRFNRLGESYVLGLIQPKVRR